MREYIIIGAGAIGSVLGAYLKRKGIEVILIDENKEHIETINSQGLTIETPTGSFNTKIDAFSTEDFMEQRKESLKNVILSVKAQDTKRALMPFIELLDEDSSVVSCQNGLTESLVSEVIGEERTIGCFVNIYSDYLSPGLIKYGGQGSLYLGELNGEKSDRLYKIKEDLSKWGTPVITDNINGFIWSKLAYGSVLATTALVDEKMATILSLEQYRPVFVRIAKEILCVAKEENINLENFEEWDPYSILDFQINSKEVEEVFDNLVSRLKTYTKVKSGVWRDLAIKKKKTEMHSQLTPVFERAEKHSLNLPITRKMLELISEIEDGIREMSYNNLDILKRLT
ncbi:2-dehydropantoate 2-reductase [Salinicoccus roseus]|uniref:ketopantoate reductase family protein n=1 Tax=Salinicoccus roseus TaxID=45670 RepID=UPI001CA691EA|nr:2-dehydropantoate 2-reductase [Salinicoccus roseus]MBY8908253.1 2-dehydropantoate 2-reductase [Salinicoccus roseus]